MGWPGEEHPHTGVVTAGREGRPGYTAEQKADVARLREMVWELSIEVSTHPYWATREGEARVGARMALKHHLDAAATPPETEQCPQKEDRAPGLSQTSTP